MSQILLRALISISPFPLQVQTRNIRCLPDVLVINCEVNSSKEADFWKTQAEVGETLQGRSCLSPAEVFTLLSLSLASLPPPEPCSQRTWWHLGHAWGMVCAFGVGKDEIWHGRAEGTAGVTLSFPQPPRTTKAVTLGCWISLVFSLSPTLISLSFPCSWPGCHPHVPSLSLCADTCLCFVASIPFRKP